MMKPAYIYKAKMVYVVDGDTADFMVDEGFQDFSLIRIRFSRINTPEEGQPGYDEAKAFVKDFEGQEVIIQTEKTPADETKPGGWGRWLAEVYVMDDGDQRNLNDWILGAGLAKPYKR